MRKALFILMLAAVGIILGVVLSPARLPAWRPNVGMKFLGFTNTVAGAPATNACFGLGGLRVSPYSWEVLEIARQQGGGWKRWEPLPVHHPKLHVPPFHGFISVVSVPVPATNVPLRVVFEIGENGPNINPPSKVKVIRSYENWRYRWRRWLYPGNPARWLPRVPTCCITNEFNFAGTANSTVGK